MARRPAGNIWARLAQQQARWILRRAVREGQKALRRSPRTAATTARKALVAGAHEHSGIGIATGPAGLRRYRFFKPEGLPKGPLHPLIIMLHGCSQSAADFAASTRMDRLATLNGFMVLYPEQDRLANAQGCWNWFDTRSGRAQREAASMVAALDHACGLHAIDPGRVAIVGLSAGASMAALVALHFPQRFAAVIMHSGVEPTMAHSTATALSAMRASYRVGPQPTGCSAPQALPALLVIQGSADSVVHRANGMRAAQTWAARTHAKPGAARLVRRGKRYPQTAMDWFESQRLQISLREISGLGHAWSGGAASQAYSDPKGPDASRMAWSFAQRQFEHNARRSAQEGLITS